MAQQGALRRLAQHTTTAFLTADPRLLVALFAVALLLTTASVSVAAGELVTGIEASPEMASTAETDGPTDP
mgnify:CR=1 FL=1|jgi:hypothetical protein